MDEARKEMVEWWKSIPEELREGPYDRSTVVAAFRAGFEAGHTHGQARGYWDGYDDACF